MNKRYSKSDTRLRLFFQKLLIDMGQLPPHGVWTCVACKAMKDLHIDYINYIPSNCMGLQQNNFWCPILNLYK